MTHRHKRCFSVAECAEELGISRNHLYKYIDSGEVASFKLGQRRLINHEALDEFRLSLQQKHSKEIKGVK